MYLCTEFNRNGMTILNLSRGGLVIDQPQISERFTKTELLFMLSHCVIHTTNIKDLIPLKWIYKISFW